MLSVDSEKCLKVNTETQMTYLKEKEVCLDMSKNLIKKPSDNSIFRLIKRGELCILKENLGHCSNNSLKASWAQCPEQQAHVFTE